MIFVFFSFFKASTQPSGRQKELAGRRRQAIRRVRQLVDSRPCQLTVHRWGIKLVCGKGRAIAVKGILFLPTCY